MQLKELITFPALLSVTIRASPLRYCICFKTAGERQKLLCLHLPIVLNYCFFLFLTSLLKLEITVFFLAFIDSSFTVT